MSANNSFSYEQLFARNAAEPAPLGMPRRGRYDFAVAYPDPETLPLDELVEGLRQALAEEGRDLAIYHHRQGYPPLREYVANKLARDRDIHVSPDDIILGDGSSQPIHMIVETLVDPGDVLLTEDFVYSGTLNTMRRFRADIRGVPCDEQGMLPDALEAAIRQARAEGKRVKFIYTVPTFQNPQGWTMPLERRQAMVELAQRYDVPILEDDCYVDLRYEGSDVPSLYALDGTGRVMYVASFSKIIAPGMRLGYMTAPRELLQRALAAKSGGAVNTFAAFAVHRFATGQLHSHIEVINDVQRRKRDAMLAALEEHFGDGVTWSRPQGGLYIWVRLPEQADLVSIRDRVLETEDVGYVPGTAFAADGVSGRNYMRLCFGYNTPEEIQEGIARLAAACRREGMLAD
ncbi:PLP-dependent aminotransferase family protein [Litorilinea aerophila]|uniref:PLP-dependent aminotransferase family protein n=1 Tax=Litorilinea aerophila TaxID=1204385 RepID=A0A540VJ34_9CHLR|nr:PLP-dependent aminotransferase family protein [Litorilinea aerophila]MCC9075654.1 PLP-dependent aminotransferase family protein [Litorilinea aerophila]GIV80251.1 MAG: aminotransferase [Litorilinea sp.]